MLKQVLIETNVGLFLKTPHSTPHGELAVMFSGEPWYGIGTELLVVDIMAVTLYVSGYEVAKHVVNDAHKHGTIKLYKFSPDGQLV